jgi:hypothetical protein
MLNIAEWEVDLAIFGAITVSTHLEIDAQKGRNHPFWTKVKLKRAAQGTQATVVARAATPEEANDAAVYFVGQMLDVLCLRLDLPLYVSLSSPEFRPLSKHVKRRVNIQEWSEAFRLGREYGIERRTFSRALSWYRKGLISEDPIDKLMAFWLSLEVVGVKYTRNNDRTQGNKTKNKILDCFDQLWGTTENWRIIPNEPSWVDKFHEKRNGIAHGYLAVEVETIKEIAFMLPKLQKLAHAFLVDWEQTGLEIETAKG